MLYSKTKKKSRLTVLLNSTEKPKKVFGNIRMNGKGSLNESVFGWISVIPI